MASEESNLELSGDSRMTGENEEAEGPELSGGHEDASDQETGEHEEEAGGQEQEAGPSSAAYSRGRWEGSDVSEAEIQWLYRSRRIPEGVVCWIPGDEREPDVEPGEVVVFTAHFVRGFGLPGR